MLPYDNFSAFLPKSSIEKNQARLWGGLAMKAEDGYVRMRAEHDRLDWSRLIWWWQTNPGEWTQMRYTRARIPWLSETVNRWVANKVSFEKVFLF